MMGPPTHAPKVLRMSLPGTLGSPLDIWDCLVEPVVGVAQAGAVVFVDAAMECVGAGPGDDGDLRAGGPSESRVRS